LYNLQITVSEVHTVSSSAKTLLGKRFLFGFRRRFGDLVSFDNAYREFMIEHEKQRRGEQLRRLKDGHGHAEKLFLEQVWWPAFGHLEQLIPEYEINDFKDGTRYLDFALLTEYLRLAIEIDGYGPHLQKMSRSQFSDQWLRQNHLVIDGWKILRFSYDDVKERPRMCEQLIQQFMGRWHSGQIRNIGRLSSEERDVLRFGMRIHRSFTPKEICLLLDIEKQKARKLLHGLLENGLLVSGGIGNERIYCYQLSKKVTADELWM
jgi:hypothetical protein